MDSLLWQRLGPYNNLHNHPKFKRHCYSEDIHPYNNPIVNGFWERLIGLTRENLNKVLRKASVYLDTLIFSSKK